MAAILRITARRDGFRRAGLAHPAVAVDHPVAELTEDQIDALTAEPMLVVERLTTDDPVPPASPARGKGKPEGTTT